MRAELSDINSIKLPRSEGTGFIYLFFREEHIECDARIITDVSMGTCLHGDNLGKFTRRTKWSMCVCAWRRRGQSAKPACVSNMHLYVCVCMPASISVGLLSSLNIQISEFQMSLHICTAPPLLTSFWWRTSYSVLCLSSVSIRISGIASIFIPVTVEGRKSTIYYRW